VILVSAIIGTGPKRAEVLREPGRPFRDLWQRELIGVRLRVDGQASATTRYFTAAGSAHLIHRAAQLSGTAAALAAWEEAAQFAHGNTESKPLTTAAKLLAAGDVLARLVAEQES